MAETYSIAQKGAHAHNPFRPLNVTLPDSSARTGTQLQAVALGTQMLCQLPDGGQAYYYLDDRTDPQKGIVFVRRV